jgi:hypothetical protein
LNILKTKLDPRIKIDIEPVKNHFFGLSVTVSGLLTARDINRKISTLNVKYDRVILPPNCVNERKQFLDDEIVKDRRALIAPPSVQELLQCLQ